MKERRKKSSLIDEMTGSFILLFWLQSKRVICPQLSVLSLPAASPPPTPLKSNSADKSTIAIIYAMSNKENHHQSESFFGGRRGDSLLTHRVHSHSFLLQERMISWQEKKAVIRSKVSQLIVCFHQIIL